MCSIKSSALLLVVFMIFGCSKPETEYVHLDQRNEEELLVAAENSEVIRNHLFPQEAVTATEIQRTNPDIEILDKDGPWSSKDDAPSVRDILQECEWVRTLRRLASLERQYTAELGRVISWFPSSSYLSAKATQLDVAYYFGAMLDCRISNSLTVRMRRIDWQRSIPRISDFDANIELNAKIEVEEELLNVSLNTYGLRLRIGHEKQ